MNSLLAFSLVAFDEEVMNSTLDKASCDCSCDSGNCGKDNTTVKVEVDIDI